MPPLFLLPSCHSASAGSRLGEELGGKGHVPASPHIPSERGVGGGRTGELGGLKAVKGVEKCWSVTKLRLFTNPQICKAEKRSPHMAQPCAQTRTQWKMDGVGRRRRGRRERKTCSVRYAESDLTPSLLCSIETPTVEGPPPEWSCAKCVNLETRALPPHRVKAGNCL